MRILDRYILTSIFGIFVGTMLTFGFLFILIDTFGNLQDFIEKKVPLSMILQYYITFLPNIIVNTSTIACLIASVFAYSSLNSHNEIIAVRASGMNFWKITRPAIIFAALISTIVFLVNERFVPQSSVINQQIKDSQIKITISDKAQGRQVINNITFSGLKNRLFYVGSFNPNSVELNDIIIIEQDQNQNLRKKIVAQKGKWTGIAWKFINCQITEYNTTKPNVPGDVHIYPEKLMDIRETPQDLMRQKKDVSALNLVQLHSYIERFANSGPPKSINNLKVDFHEKIAFPFRTLIIVLLGLPFALMTGRRKAMTFTSIGIAVVIGFLYYVIDAVGLAMGKGGGLPPPAAAWLAPAIFVSAAFITIRHNFGGNLIMILVTSLPALTIFVVGLLHFIKNNSF